MQAPPHRPGSVASEMSCRPFGARMLAFIERRCFGEREEVPCRVVRAGAASLGGGEGPGGLSAGSGVNTAARSRNAAAAASPPRARARSAECSSSSRDVLVGPARGVGEMPGAAIGVVGRIGDVGQRAVRRPALIDRARPVHSRARKWVAEGDRAVPARGVPRTRALLRIDPTPSRDAARRISAGSPVGSSAAINSS